ncbi:MAG: 4'-phosphopantetheinyl transferase superfamily protein [Bacteroidetes bacterium]|nr:4'-phosphopantetheinyl transferase superfamily protein [Bacteroidota bacterium]
MNWLTVNDLKSITTTGNLFLVYGRSLPGNSERLSKYLDENERCKYEKNRSTTPLECRAVLRMLLSRFLNSPPETIRIPETKTGKPYVEGKGLFFNVSHCESSYLVAISKVGRVGVDMECLSGNEDIVSLADYAFSENEKHVCFNTGDRAINFTKIWTLKEALLKASGTGLMNNLSQLNVFEKLQQYGLNFNTFSCPGSETASVVYRGVPGFMDEPRYFHLIIN